MVSLARISLGEVEALAEEDPGWWPGLCMEIAENGLNAALKEKKKRKWHWGAVWGWITADEKRYQDYQRALEAYTQLKAHERIGIADDATPEDVAVAKLRVEVRKDFAAKVDRDRWGEKVKTETNNNLLLVDAGLAGFASKLLEKMKPVEKLVSE